MALMGFKPIYIWASILRWVFSEHHTPLKLIEQGWRARSVFERDKPSTYFLCCTATQSYLNNGVISNSIIMRASKSDLPCASDWAVLWPGGELRGSFLPLRHLPLIETSKKWLGEDWLTTALWGALGWVLIHHAQYPGKQTIMEAM